MKDLIELIVVGIIGFVLADIVLWFMGYGSITLDLVELIWN